MATNRQDSDSSESIDPTGETADRVPAGERDDGTVTRRAAMALAGVTGAGLLGGAVGQVGATNNPRPRRWEQDVDAQGHTLSDLGALEMAGSEPITDFAGENLSIESGVLRATSDRDLINNVRYVDVAEGATAVQEAVDAADAEGHNKVVVYGDEGEWNRTVYLPSEFTLEILDGVTITSTMDESDTEVFHGGAALITNDDHENGNHDITVRGGHIDFDGVDSSQDGIRWGPVWLHTVDNALFDSITVENVDWRYGIVFTDCTRSKIVDCLARNTGYDGITLRGTCEHVDVVRCSTYDNVNGPGIQAAPSIGEGGTGGHHLTFTDCRMDEHLAIHGVRGGITDVAIQGCSVRRIGIIQEVDGFRISDCDVDTIAFSAFTGEIRNGRVDSCTMAPRYADHDAQIPAAVVLWTWANDLIENVSFSNCTARDLDKFVECRILDETSVVRHIDFSNCAFDVGDGDEPRAFIEHTRDDDWVVDSVGELSNVRIHDCKIWNTDSIIQGEVDGVRIRLTEFHGVDEDALDDGDLTNLETHQNDWW
ncbi:hypothetical protein ACFQO4_01050 [Saliphagus sp. GCM10025334]